MTTTLTVASEGHGLSLTLHQWINEGLMAVFFLLVGLEIKRAVLAGQLSAPRHALLPIAAALGGMFLPAAIYFVTNPLGFQAENGRFLWRPTSRSRSAP